MRAASSLLRLPRPGSLGGTFRGSWSKGWRWCAPLRFRGPRAGGRRRHPCPLRGTWPFFIPTRPRPKMARVSPGWGHPDAAGWAACWRPRSCSRRRPWCSTGAAPAPRLPRLPRGCRPGRSGTPGTQSRPRTRLRLPWWDGSGLPRPCPLLCAHTRRRRSCPVVGRPAQDTGRGRRPGSPTAWPVAGPRRGLLLPADLGCPCPLP